jgi:hypothetical protein
VRLDSSSKIHRRFTHANVTSASSSAEMQIQSCHRARKYPSGQGPRGGLCDKLLSAWTCLYPFVAAAVPSPALRKIAVEVMEYDRDLIDNPLPSQDSAQKDPTTI